MVKKTTTELYDVPTRSDELRIGVRICALITGVGLPWLRPKYLGDTLQIFV